MPRIALGLSYDGGGYQGWQTQPSGRTVQDKLEQALLEFARTPIRTHCAGRTDAGVHALMQVVHFDVPLQRRAISWVRGINRYLPRDIAVQWAREVPSSFHARSCAQARKYSYLILQSPVRPSLQAGKVGWIFRELDMQAMHEAASFLAGKHDFSAFRASGCQALSPVKTMDPIEIRQRGALWRFDFQADAFLYHMIRNIMGCLIFVGQGARRPGWLAEILREGRREHAAPTFMPDGLYFGGPVYAAKWALPARTVAYDWLP